MYEACLANVVVASIVTGARWDDTSGHAAVRQWNHNHDGPDLDACPKKEVPLPSVATERGGGSIHGYLGCNARYVVQVARWHTHEVIVYTTTRG